MTRPEAVPMEAAEEAQTEAGTTTAATGSNVK